MIHDVTIFLRKKAQQDFLMEIMLTQDNPALHHGNQPIFLRLRMPEWESTKAVSRDMQT